MNLGCTLNRKGFATISLLLFLPLLGLLIFSLGFTGYIVQHKTKIRSTCLTEGRAIQKTLIQNEENLFRLNPLARALRVRLRLAYLELAVAVASENPAGIAKAQMKITKIKSEQKKLDSIQKTLIQAGNFQAKAQSLALRAQLTDIDQDMNQIWSFYLRSLTHLSLLHTPAMAVVRDSADMAPVYELDRQHKEKQKVAYLWQTRFKTKSSAQQLLKSENEFELYCAVAAEKERDVWNFLIAVDKS